MVYTVSQADGLAVRSINHRLKCLEYGYCLEEDDGHH